MWWGKWKQGLWVFWVDAVCLADAVNNAASCSTSGKLSLKRGREQCHQEHIFPCLPKAFLSSLWKLPGKMASFGVNDFTLLEMLWNFDFSYDSDIFWATCKISCATEGIDLVVVLLIIQPHFSFFNLLLFYVLLSAHFELPTCMNFAIWIHLPRLECSELN